MYTETQAETVYVTEIYTQANDEIPESLPTWKFLGLFLAIIGVVALATISFMLHRY